MAGRAESALSIGQQLALTVGHPSALWTSPAKRTILLGLTVQWLVLFFGKLIALPENLDLEHFARGRSAGAIGVTDGIVLLLASALTVVAANAVWAALLWVATALLGLRVRYLDLFAVSTVAVLPLFLGRTVGLILLAFWMPLSHTPAELWAWRLWPFATGLITWLPHAPAALSLGWAFLSIFDVFGLWSLWLTYCGLSSRTAAPAHLRPWLGVLLVLLCCAVALGLWQTGQYWLARST